MKGETIPDSDHVGRYCGARTVDNGEITAAAFMLRSSEVYLSVNWMEELKQPDRNTQIRELQDLYSRKLKVSATARIAILNVGAFRNKVAHESSDGRSLQVIHEPEFDDPSHSGVYGFSHDDEMIAELIAETILETCLAKRS
jgi:hypothetical protein